MSARASVRRLGLVCGLLAPVVFIFLYLIAVAEDTGYEFYEDYLSDLGVGSGAWAFNAAVMIAGALVIPFAQLGLRDLLGPGVSSLAGTSLLSLAGLMLFFVGVFTEDAGDVHLYFSLAFFFTLYISFAPLTAAYHRSKVLGRSGTIATLAVFVVGLALIPFGANPHTETVAVMAALVWSFVVSSALLLREVRLRQPQRPPFTP